MRKFFLFLLLCFLTMIVSGCGLVKQFSPTEAVSVEETAKAPSKYVELKFETHVPANTREDEKVFLQILDEVTGLLINPVTYEMDRTDASLYVANIPVPLNSVVKYRYTFGDSQTNIEFTPNGQPVRYRMVYASQSTRVEDTVGTWTGEFTGNYGRVIGVVQDENGNPMSNSLIVIAGNQSLSSNTGAFLIDGIPVGQHNLVVYSLEGKHEVFQQEVLVATDMASPVEVSVKPSNLVNVTFHLTVPDDAFTKLPVRMIGNQFQTGNVFTDLVGGISVPASRAPYLNYSGGREHEVVLQLPAGLDFRYKYSHGDGFWSGEQSTIERFPVRQFIVPENDIDIYDEVESWDVSQKSPVSFIVEVPAEMPQNGSVSIQFRPYDWMTPIPMWQIDETHWFFALTSPLDYFDELNYRYCLNGDCNRTPEVNLDGLMIQRKVNLTAVPVNIEDSITGWRWYDKASDGQDAFSVTAQSKDNSFLFGFEVEKNSSPDTQGYAFQGIQAAVDLNSETVVFSPGWTYTRINIPNLEPVIGTTITDMDLAQQLYWANQSKLRTGVFPSTDYGRFADYFWEYAQQDFGWWQSLFDRYRGFLSHYTLFAEQNNAAFLVLGEPKLQEAYQQFQSVTQPGITGEEFDRFLGNVLQEVHESFSGEIYWAVDFDGTSESLLLPEGIDEFIDGYYVLWHAEQSSDGLLTPENYAPLFMENLETLKVLAADDKAVILAFNYPAVAGAEQGGLYQGENYQKFALIEDYSVFSLDEHTQSVLYSIAFNAVESQPWIGGFISRGFSLRNGVPDPSPSIRGKTAEPLFKLWFGQWSSSN